MSVIAMKASGPSGSTAAPRVGVLFVCLGNICRSPLAKWIFADAAKRRGHSERLEIDSCGTGHWHVGEGADPRSVAVGHRFGLDTSHTVRQLAPVFDFQRYSYLIAMDRSNAKRMLDLGAPRERVHLIRLFDPAHAHFRTRGMESHPEVPDPYTMSDAAFEDVYWMLQSAAGGLLDHMAREHGWPPRAEA